MKTTPSRRSGVTDVTGEPVVPARLPQVRSTYYFRRAVPDELRPYFLAERGKPRTEFMISLDENDLGPAKDKWRAKAVEVAGWINEARDKLARGIPPDHVVLAEAKAEADRLSPGYVAEFDAMEAGATPHIRR